MSNSDTLTTGYWDCDCGRECREPGKLPGCRAQWVETDEGEGLGPEMTPEQVAAQIPLVEAELEKLNGTLTRRNARGSKTTDLKAVMAEARLLTEMHLPEICREMLAWRDTGLLPEGRFREIAGLLRPVSEYDSLGIAESLAKYAAFERVAHAGQ